MDALPRHQCLIYAGAPSISLASIAATIIEKLKANIRCLYLNSPPMVVGIRAALYAAGLEAQREVERGSLILSSSQDHLVDGKFDPDRMLNSLVTAVHRAVTDGYEGLWATGDITWELGNEKSLGKLLVYERKLEHIMRCTPALSGICQYHRDTLPDHAIETAFATHRAMYINETLTRLNLHYQEA